MTGRKQSSSFVLSSLILSLIGLSLLPFLLLYHPPSGIIPWRTQLIGGAFAIICILGIIAGISPTHCSRFVNPKEKIESNEPRMETNAAETDQIHKKGHHPTCDHYVAHVIRIQTRTFCAGCTGLVIGAVIALIGTIPLFFGSFWFIFPIFFFWLGWIFVAVGLLQHPIYRKFQVQRGIVRVLVNVFFVMGAFLLVVSVLQVTDSLVLGTYLLVLILYWIFTRMVMSRRSHQRICALCARPTCPLSEP